MNHHHKVARAPDLGNRSDPLSGLGDRFELTSEPMEGGAWKSGGKKKEEGGIFCRINDWPGCTLGFILR